jgi:hypothetical protein
VADARSGDEHAIADLICDLGHLADHLGFDFLSEVKKGIGHCVTAQPPADMPEGSPFGPGIKAAVAYLHGCQMVGFKGLTELCEGLFGLTISQGAISNMLARMGKPFGAAAEQIAAIGLRAPLARSGVEWLPLVGWHPAIAERRTQYYSKSSKPRRCSLFRDRLADPFLHHVGDLVGVLFQHHHMAVAVNSHGTEIEVGWVHPSLLQVLDQAVAVRGVE